MTELHGEHATYADLERVPAHLTAEIADGELVASPHPGPRQVLVASTLLGELHPPFQRGRGGPGGWLQLLGPELHIGSDVLVPDLAAWRRTRLPVLPGTSAFELAPDWLCEVLSPSTAAFDRAVKLPIYAREGVGHVWLVDPLLQTLEVLRLDGSGYRLLGTWRGDAVVRCEPFEALELRLSDLWTA